jgi:hypothetical protein
MRYQVQNTKEMSSVKFKFNLDGLVKKTKKSVYEDGVKLIKEFQN